MSSLRDYLAEIISSLLLIASAVLLFFKAYYLPMVEYKEALKKMESDYALKIAKLKQQEESENEKSEEKENRLSAIPNLLKRINDTCKEPKVIIRELLPDKSDPFKFELKFIADYFEFLRVLSEFEKLDIAIDGISLHPYMIDKNNPKHIVTMNVRAIGNGERLDPKLVKFLDDELAKKNRRNPFQRFAKLGKNIKRIIDLTWIYKLSGIGRIDGEFVATINHKQYFKGDSFDGFIVTSITSDGVRLKKSTSNGDEIYIINFRKIKK